MTILPDSQFQVLSDPALPAPLPELVGRHAELGRLRERLSTRGHAATTVLNGLPGVGKTALLVTLAHDASVRAHFRDGILWAGLGPHAQPQSHWSRWGRLLGISSAEMRTFESDVDWARALRQAIGTRAMLLLIDDVWMLEDALALKIGGPNCVHVVSTRSPAIAAAVTVDGAITLEELSDVEGLTLLRRLAPDVVESDVPRARELVELVGGLPLALTLIGNSLRRQSESGRDGWSLPAALGRLNDAGERLHICDPFEPGQEISTPMSLHTVIAVTDQQLPKPASRALYALSVFPPRPNSFSEEAALAVTDGRVEILDQLVDTGLLETSGFDRYSLHQTIADYAHLHFSDTNALQWLVTSMMNVVETHQNNYDLLEIESANMLATLDAAIELAMHDELVRIICAFASFLLTRSLYSTAERYLQRAYTVVLGQNNRYGLAHILFYLGDMAWKRRQSEQAEKYFHEGLSHAHVILDNRLICEMLARLGTIRWKSGNYLEAEAFLKEGLSLARRTAHVEDTSEILSILGSVAMRQGQYTQSEAFLREGLSLARQTGARERMCPILLNLGLLTAEQSKPDEAESLYKESLTLARELGHSEWISVSLNNLGDVASEQGDFAQAEAYFQEGLQLARSIDQLEGVSFLLMNLGAVAWKQGKYEVAEQVLQEGLVLSQRIGIPLVLSHTLNEYGNLHLARKQPEQAEAMFQKMLETVPEGSQDLVALARYGLARALALQGKRNEAIELGTISVRMLEAIGRNHAREVREWLNGFESRPSCQ